jgi:hypothetical protein
MMDRGPPLAGWTVSGELGHSSTAMVERVYKKPGQVRSRADVVEYRVEQQREKLQKRLEAMR